ncbi:MAG TPA: hypothetical protein VK790_13745 [Solirubrobacteraceae bacterium]|jgi:hypothetical protein|nr:hypothetical protein [Solirubrobacteraceae bacterium]
MPGAGKPASASTIACVDAIYAPHWHIVRLRVDVLHGTTGGPAFVRTGSTRIAGGAVPARIPARGTVRFAGRSWSAFSWEAVPPARVYLLTPSS